jgi:hypothetical protein
VSDNRAEWNWPFHKKFATMGTAPVSKPIRHPRRPFAANHKTCVMPSKILVAMSQSGTLQQLVLLRDWQRVLIRAKMFPSELSQPIRMQLYGLSVQVLPLHLACTLEPPREVVELFLELYVDAAGTPVLGRKKTGIWRRNRRNMKDEEDDDKQQLLPGKPTDDGESSHISNCYSVPYFPTRDDVSVCSSSLLKFSSSSSKTPWSKNSIILQLSPSGGVAPLAVNDSQETQSTNSTEDHVFAVNWDLQPLWELVQSEEGEILALHLACLYQCSSSVVEILVQRYPFAALCDVLGMLPIHIVAAGWILHPIQARLHSPIPTERPNPVDILKVLLGAVPETATAKSLHDGRTAQDYIEEYMEEGSQKEDCLAILQQEKVWEEEKYDDDSLSLSTIGSIIFMDSSDSQSSVATGPCLGGLAMLLQHLDWESALQILEGDPMSARKWLYGVDECVDSPIHVWKRLPIHLACAYGAPVGLVDVLLKAYPDSARIPDDLDCLPLHMACGQTGADLRVVDRLLKEYPTATKIVNPLLAQYITAMYWRFCTLSEYITTMYLHNSPK